MSEIRKKMSLPSRYEDKGKNIWVEYAELASQYKPLDLGHGFPNFSPPQYVKDALLEVGSNPNNLIHQYTRGAGHPRLVEALSKLYSQMMGRVIDPWTQILTTQGGYHAIFCSLMGIVEPGDEVIIMEPFFDSYGLNTICAGGIPRYISFKLRKNSNGGPVTAADFIIDKQELENLFNSKTKAIIVNTPHNPLGKVFSYEELEHIAFLCKKWDVICIADEVYEWLVYDSKKHIKMATLPGMFERTITIGSAGKMFGVTGWKLGWVYGPQHLIRNLSFAFLNSVRAGNTVLQEAAAICVEKELTRLEQDDCYFISLRKDLEGKRNFMYKILSETGMKPILSEGGYFMVANWSPLEKYVDLSKESDKYKDYRFTKWMTKNVGVQGIPTTPFYSEEHKHLGEHFIRYCFVKTDDYLEKVARALSDWKPYLET